MLCLQVRFTATRATVAFVLANESDTTVLNHIKDLLPLIIQVCLIFSMYCVRIVFVVVVNCCIFELLAQVLLHVCFIVVVSIMPVAATVRMVTEAYCLQAVCVCASVVIYRKFVNVIYYKPLMEISTEFTTSARLGTKMN